MPSRPKHNYYDLRIVTEHHALTTCFESDRSSQISLQLWPRDIHTSHITTCILRMFQGVCYLWGVSKLGERIKTLEKNNSKQNNDKNNELYHFIFSSTPQIRNEYHRRFHHSEWYILHLKVILILQCQRSTILKRYFKDQSSEALQSSLMECSKVLPWSAADFKQ